MFLLLSFILFSGNLIQVDAAIKGTTKRVIGNLLQIAPQLWNEYLSTERNLSNDLYRKYAVLQSQYNEMKSNLFNINEELVATKASFTKKMDNLEKEINGRTSAELENDDDEQAPIDIKDMKKIRKEMISKLHFIKRKLKPTNVPKNKKGKKIQIITLYGLKQEFEQFKKAMKIEVAELAQQLKDLSSNQDVTKEEEAELQTELEDNELYQALENSTTNKDPIKMPNKGMVFEPFFSVPNSTDNISSDAQQGDSISLEETR